MIFTFILAKFPQILQNIPQQITKFVLKKIFQNIGLFLAESLESFICFDRFKCSINMKKKSVFAR